MTQTCDIVVTAVGVVSPIGIGAPAFWDALCQGKSGVRRLPEYDKNGVPVCLGAPVADFDPKTYVRPRKSLKVMSHDIQLGVAAAGLAWDEAKLDGAIDPERLGVIFGADLIQMDPVEIGAPVRACLREGKFDFSLWGTKALAEFFPLWMLKYLPNMPACHVTILANAQGPNNTITLGDVSSLTAVAEAADVIRRGWADAMLAGGAFSRVHPTFYIRSFNSQESRRSGDPARACRPFDRERDGLVNAEGAAALLLERREHAEARRAPILARLLASGSAYEPVAPGRAARGRAIRHAIAEALRKSHLLPADVGFVEAHGASTTHDDRIEAQAIRDVLGDVPVTALKSYFGHAGAAGGAMELAGAVLSLAHGRIVPTLNYEQPDPECPINVVRGSAALATKPVALKISHSPRGQAVALVLSGGGVVPLETRA